MTNQEPIRPSDVLPLGVAVGFGLVTGVAATAATTIVLMAPESPAGRLVEKVLTGTLRLLLGRRARLHRRRRKKGAIAVDVASGNYPPMPLHFALRPRADPREDQSRYVVYQPASATKSGAIVIVIPGGNFDTCEVNCHEGQPVAQWLVEMGITAVVLKYRCVSQGHYWPAQMEDWEECARQVLGSCESWGCDSSRIGVIGFSAGGHLAASAATRSHPRIRPKLQILVYPSIDTETPRKDGDIDPWFPDKGYPAPDTSCYLHVDSITPPAFLAGINGDRYCPHDENTDVYADALRTEGIPFKYVVNEKHQHGCGLKDWWTVSCAQWLKQQGWTVPLDRACSGGA